MKAEATAPIQKGQDFAGLESDVESASPADPTTVASPKPESSAGADRSESARLLGDSAAMAVVRDTIAQVADADVPVLLVGESGTGKELAARSLHGMSSRRDGPFVALNCTSVASGLLESELFGHVRGAFTDAGEDRPGLLVGSDGGTLFLDEVGDMPLEMQAKLLRALQERVVRPVGGVDEVAFDTRVIAATHQDLEARMRSGDFREDLYYRLNVVQIAMPALRDRSEDILRLAHIFTEAAAEAQGKPTPRLTSATETELRKHDWPGNVRELENAMQHAVALCGDDDIRPEHLPERVQATTPSPEAIERTPELVTLDELEHVHIHRVLDAVDDNKSEAARVLGIDRRTLHRKLAREEDDAKGEDS